MHTTKPIITLQTKWNRLHWNAKLDQETDVFSIFTYLQPGMVNYHNHAHCKSARWLSHRLLANFEVSLSSKVRLPAWPSATADGPLVTVCDTGTRWSWTTPPWTVRRPGTMRGKRADDCGDVTFNTCDLDVPLHTMILTCDWGLAFAARQMLTFTLHRSRCLANATDHSQHAKSGKSHTEQHTPTNYWINTPSKSHSK